ncbi:transcription elongation factor (TFIIS) family protein [Carex rostrata]
MDPSEERLRQVLGTGVDIWSLIDTAIAVAVRDHPADLRLRREGIVQSLYALTPCRNCDPNRSNFANGHGPDSTRTNGDGSVVTLVNGNGPVVNPGYGIEESPDMRAVSPTPSPELEIRHREREDENETEASIREIISMREFLEDTEQWSDEESLVCLLQSLADMDVTYEVLFQTDIARHVTAIRKQHQCEEVRQLAKHIISKWKMLLNAQMKTNSACDSSSSPVPTENGSPQMIAPKSRPHNSSGPHEFVRSPKRQNGVGSSERSGSDYLPSKAGSSSRSEARAKPATNDRSSIPSVAPPAKRKEKEDSLADQARLESARKKLQENYQEVQNAKKQRTVQVMSINEIPKPRNGFIRRGGSTSRNR